MILQKICPSIQKMDISMFFPANPVWEGIKIPIPFGFANPHNSTFGPRLFIYGTIIALCADYIKCIGILIWPKSQRSMSKAWPHHIHQANH